MDWRKWRNHRSRAIADTADLHRICSEFNDFHWISFVTLTLGHYTICLKHRAILRVRTLISSVDSLRNFVDAKLDMRILSDSDVRHLNRFQSKNDNLMQ